MSNIVDLNGNSYTKNSNGKVTQSQAGAILVSEIDLAIESWNKNAVAHHNGDEKAAPLLAFNFEQYEYAQPIKEKIGKFGYAKLWITIQRSGKLTEIYSKGEEFTKENELRNVNGYFPAMVMDCAGFLFASAFMYNIAIAEQIPNEEKQPENADKIHQRGDSPEGQPGDGDKS